MRVVVQSRASVPPAGRIRGGRGRETDPSLHAVPRTPKKEKSAAPRAAAATDRPPAGASAPAREEFNRPNVSFDNRLRPVTFDDFVGQEKVRDRLLLSVQAAKQRGDALDHVLLSGPPGLGKTTLCYILAREMGVKVHATSGPVIEKPSDLAGMLTGLDRGDILFIDEIHRMQTAVEEYLYSAMEDYVLDIMIDQGPNARSIRLELPRFTLVGATTRQGLLSAPLRSRFSINARLDYYTPEELALVVKRSAGILGVEIDAAGAREIAGRSRGTARVANNLLRRVRDFAQVRAGNRITAEVADEALGMEGIDRAGLDEMDKRILSCICEDFGGGPVGLGTIAVSVGEEAGTIEDVYEPYLIQEGYIARTFRGREATPLAFKALGLGTVSKRGQPTLGI
ncbi:MAG: Holliday junction branch migration DNA helicase RuvB [Kiritimatiellae bacterium]|nr:Holliday junction branch migration DNA helicase RuvB [Kiritimatiellia bacterium]